MRNPFVKQNIIKRNEDNIVLVAACVTLARFALPTILDGIAFVGGAISKGVRNFRDARDAHVQ